MNFLHIILIAAGLWLFCMTVADIHVYGAYMSSAKIRAYILKNKPRMWINSINNRIINVYPVREGDSELISCNRVIRLFSKWYLRKDGRNYQIFRWSKAHRLIEKIYKSLPSSEEHSKSYHPKN